MDIAGNYLLFVSCILLEQYASINMILIFISFPVHLSAV